MASKVTPLNVYIVRQRMPTDDSTSSLWHARGHSGDEAHFRRLIKLGWLEIIPGSTDRVRYTELAKTQMREMGAFSGRNLASRAKERESVVIRYGRAVK